MREILSWCVGVIVYYVFLLFGRGAYDARRKAMHLVYTCNEKVSSERRECVPVVLEGVAKCGGVSGNVIVFFAPNEVCRRFLALLVA
jgi:hypothetical protein